MPQRSRPQRVSSRAPSPRRPAKPERAGFRAPQASEPTELLGVIETYGRRVMIVPLSKDLARLSVEAFPPKGEAYTDGDVVRFTLGDARGRQGAVGEILENMGPDPKGVESLAAILNHGLPVAFPDEVLHDVEALKPYVFSADDGREDWRDLPFVTIDGADARDFDDAVCAQPENGGFRVWVAIADVAHYVRVGSALDADARERGNSTYFPDRVVPMLPERLSNDLCSLRPREDRPVLGIEMKVGPLGRLEGFRVVRAVIFSHARLIYERVEEVLTGQNDGGLEPKVLASVMALKGAWEFLDKARVHRGALDFNLPETQLIVGEDGQVTEIKARARLISHRLIEEMMVLANVAAATVLSTKTKANLGAGLYRIHDKPNKDKVALLAAALAPLGYKVPPVDGSGPKIWAPLVARLNEHPASKQLLRAVLQAQQQARYETSNIGHYGLSLPLYAHFTSPIRRYADLVTHRAMLASLGLGPQEEALPAPQVARIAEHINLTERRSQQAEWEARDRLVCRHFGQFVGEEFVAMVTNALTFGCFVSVEGMVEGMMPGRFLEPMWRYSPRAQLWKGSKGLPDLAMGVQIPVMLEQADLVTGRLTFAPVLKAKLSLSSPPNKKR